MNGKEFTEMRKRQEAAEEQNRIRREKFLQKQQEAEEAERRARKAKLEANKQSMTMVTKNQLTWRELQEIEEAKRRDRIERRKQELAQISALPSSIAENLQKAQREAPADAKANSFGEFKAEDPAKVSFICLTIQDFAKTLSTMFKFNNSFACLFVCITQIVL